MDAAHVRQWAVAFLALVSFMLAAAPAIAATPSDQDPTLDVVAVAIVGNGQAILLATSGLEDRRHRWRFRSFDTSDVPQPIRDVSLAASGTKLFFETGAGPAKTATASLSLLAASVRQP